MSSSLRFAFVGCGGIARHHLRALGASGHAAQLAAVVDTRENNAREFIKLVPKNMLSKDSQVRKGWGLFCT